MLVRLKELVMEFPPPPGGTTEILEQTGAFQEKVVLGKVEARLMLVVKPEQRLEFGPGVVVASGKGLTVKIRV